MKKKTIEEIKEWLFQVHGNILTLDETTYKNLNIKCRFVDIDFGGFWNTPAHVLYDGRGHTKRNKTEKEMSKGKSKINHKKRKRTPKYTRPSRECLNELYENNSVPKIAKIFGVGRKIVYDWIKHYNISFIPEYQRRYNERNKYFTPQLEKLIVGSLLGDGCIEVNESGKAARYEENHSIKQKDYLVWKKDIFDGLVNNYSFGSATFNNKTYYTCKFKSVSHPRFLEYEELFYVNRTKVIKEDIEQYLDPFVLAIWFMDDGSCHKSKYGVSARIATDCFSYEDHLKLVDMLKRKFELKTKIQKDNRSGNHYLQFNQVNARRLFEIVEPHIRDGLKYKINK